MIKVCIVIPSPNKIKTRTEEIVLPQFAAKNYSNNERKEQLYLQQIASKTSYHNAIVNDATVKINLKKKKKKKNRGNTSGKSLLFPLSCLSFSTLTRLLDLKFAKRDVFPCRARHSRT